jgi:hypothetical protein
VGGRVGAPHAGTPFQGTGSPTDCCRVCMLGAALLCKSTGGACWRWLSTASRLSVGCVDCT